MMFSRRKPPSLTWILLPLIALILLSASVDISFCREAPPAYYPPLDGGGDEFPDMANPIGSGSGDIPLTVKDISPVREQPLVQESANQGSRVSAIPDGSRVFLLQVLMVARICLVL